MTFRTDAEFWEWCDMFESMICTTDDVPRALMATAVGMLAREGRDPEALLRVMLENLKKRGVI